MAENIGQADNTERAENTEPADNAGAADEPSAAAGPDDETRRKFQEALSRKHGASAAAAGHRTSGNVHLPEGNTKRQRVFRRKSGG